MGGNKCEDVLFLKLLEDVSYCGAQTEEVAEVRAHTPFVVSNGETVSRGRVGNLTWKKPTSS